MARKKKEVGGMQSIKVVEANERQGWTILDELPAAISA
jgi:hypothetical protein